MFIANSNNNSIMGANPGMISGYDIAAVKAMRAESIIDSAAYASKADKVLARVGDPIKRIIPTADELTACGIDVLKLADCLEGKFVSGRVFARMLKSESVLAVNSKLAALLS